MGVTSSRGGIARNKINRTPAAAGKAAGSRGDGARKEMSSSASPQKLTGVSLASELESAYAQIDELRQEYRRIQSDLADVKKKKPTSPVSGDLSQACSALKRDVARLTRREKAFVHLLGHIGRTVPEVSVVLRERFSEAHYRQEHPDLDKAVADGHLSDLYAHWVIQGSLEDRSVAFWPAILVEADEASE